MNLNFAFLLTIAVMLCGVLSGMHYLVKRQKWEAKLGRWASVFAQARSFFPLLLVVWLLRSFLIQPYRVPTGSLEPTVKPGDFIAASQFSYGLRWPIGFHKLISFGQPRRGEIVLFHWPVNPNIVFVKRVIGLPGDHIVYRNKQLFINGVHARQQFVQTAYDYGDAPGQGKRFVYELSEQLPQPTHHIYIQPNGGETDEVDVIVPSHHYFMLGDNRDDSGDSREWGFVPEKYLIGRGFLIWFSWDPVHHQIRWRRMGQTL